MNAHINYLTLEDLIDLGKFLIPEFAEKVAALMHSLAGNHALIDGNKRIAWSAGRLFCIMNHCDLKAPVDDAERTMMDLASGTLDVAPLTVWLNKHIIS